MIYINFLYFLQLKIQVQICCFSSVFNSNEQMQISSEKISFSVSSVKQLQKYLHLVGKNCQFVCVVCWCPAQYECIQVFELICTFCSLLIRYVKLKKLSMAVVTRRILISEKLISSGDACDISWRNPGEALCPVWSIPCTVRYALSTFFPFHIISLYINILVSSTPNNSCTLCNPSQKSKNKWRIQIILYSVLGLEFMIFTAAKLLLELLAFLSTFKPDSDSIIDHFLPVVRTREKSRRPDSSSLHETEESNVCLAWCSPVRSLGSSWGSCHYWEDEQCFCTQKYTVCH